MNVISKCCLCLLLLLLLAANEPLAAGQQQQQQPDTAALPPAGNFPYYMQSPIVASDAAAPPTEQQAQPGEQQLTQRTIIPVPMSQARQMQPPKPVGPPLEQPQQKTQQQVPQAQPQQYTSGPVPLAAGHSAQCMYDKRYFAKFDECLARRPYPTIGLPAFKNEDLLVRGSRNGLKSDPKRGCLFTLSNGLFKNYLLSGFSLDSDTQCLDSNGKLAMSLEFSNATLYYLWQLRCLNYADQLLDDATLNGKLTESLESDSARRTICAGSSQTFGFAALQLSAIEAQVELATDIYKNWRVTNVTLAFARPSAQSSESLALSSIRDFTFESLDGDELNWRYLQSFSNWSRNRLHTNFLEQFRRFVWISLQRCLSESSEKLPVKLFDLFSDHKFN